MGLVASMESMRDYLVSAGLTGIDVDNCVIEDEGVFNNILQREINVFRRAIMIGYDGMKRKGSSEFRGTLLVWHVTITVFVLLWGDVEERTAAIQDSYALVDEVFQAINDDSTLNGGAMDTAIVASESPMLYERQQMNDYMMITLHTEVTENLS